MRVPNIKKYIVSSFLLLNLTFVTFSLLMGNFIPDVEATNGTIIGVDPNLVTADPNQYFTINITVTNVTNLYYWRVQMRWTRGLLRTHTANITEGDFLKPGTTLFTEFTDQISRLDCSDSLFGAVAGKSGNGTLMTVIFKVEHSGNTTLEIFGTTLTGINPPYGPGDTYPIDHTTSNGTFYTTIPVADFTYSPDPSAGSQYLGRPIVNETVTFNASTSYDPDEPYDLTPGGIVNYSWDFDDGAVGTGQIVTHSFNQSGLYSVQLIVTDDDGETDPYQKSLTIQLHDIAVVNVTVTPSEVSAGSTATINATVHNEGSVSDHFNITAYYNRNPYLIYTPIETQTKLSLQKDQNITMTFLWDTTGIPEGNYTIAVDTLLVNRFTLESRLDEEADLSDNGYIDGNVKISGTPIHDLAITNLEVNPTNLRINQVSTIQLTIKNEGNTDENFNATITVYYGSDVFNTRHWSNLTLLAGATTTLNFNWLTGSNATKEGNYNVNATVVLINATTLDFLSPYNASTPDDDPTDNTDNIFPPPNILIYPVANFSPSATQVNVDQTVIFNATLSYTPGISSIPGFIKKYMWNFGDGVVITETDPIATHIYRTNGTFVVLLEVTDNIGLTSNASKTIIVAPFHNIVVINITFSPHILTSGGSTIINVTVNARLFTQNFNLTAYFNDNEIGTKSNLTAQFGAHAATHTFLWDTTGVAGGNYTLKVLVATLDENSTYIGSKITILKMPVTLTLTVFPSSLTLGETATIGGTTSPILDTASVTIQYRLSGEDTWNTLPTSQTGSNGTFSQTWVPPSVGIYAIKAIWQGDDTTDFSESQVSMITVQAVSLPVFMYLSVILIIAMAAMAFYFLRFWKPKPK